jgi:hypothetical protein
VNRLGEISVDQSSEGGYRIVGIDVSKSSGGDYWIARIAVGKSSGGAAFYSLRWSEAEPQERTPDI